MVKKNFKQINTDPQPLTLEQKIDEILRLLKQQDDINKQLAPYHIDPMIPNIPNWPINPMPTWSPQPNQMGGWKCPNCGMIIYPNQTHFCPGGTGPTCGGSTNSGN
jgi:hypothetical protein